MGYIKLENLIAPMTVEQQIMLSHFYQMFDNNSAAHRKILNVEPLYYDGVIAGQEFLTYAVTKMYVCFSFYASILQANIEGAAPAVINFHDETDAIDLSIHQNEGFFNATEKFIVNPVYHYNDDFARLDTTLYTYMKFIGYRFTLN
jgi:hypothetical protein